MHEFSLLLVVLYDLIIIHNRLLEEILTVFERTAFIECIRMIRIEPNNFIVIFDGFVIFTFMFDLMKRKRLSE